MQVATCWGKPSSRPPQARSKATGGGIARWGQSPPRLAERKTTRFLRSPQSGDVVLIAKQARPQVETGGELVCRHDGAVKGGVRRPQADPAREAPTGAECKPVGRAGQAQPDRKVTSESDFGKVPLSRQFTGVTFR